MDPRRPPAPARVVVRMKGPSEDGGLKTLAFVGIVGGFLAASYALFGDRLLGLPSEASVWKIAAEGNKSLGQLCSSPAGSTTVRLVADKSGHVAAASLKGPQAFIDCAKPAVEDWRFPKLSGSRFLAVQFELRDGKLGEGRISLVTPEWDVRRVDDLLDKSEIQKLLSRRLNDALDCVFRFVVTVEGVDQEMRGIGANFDVRADGTTSRHFIGDNASTIERGGAVYAHNRPAFQGCLRSVIETVPFPKRKNEDRANVMSILEFSVRPLK